MKAVRSIEDLRHARAGAAGRRVGFVPTMGALHAGHRALMVAARAECDVAVASIFVNPTQFDDPRDLAAYPRAEADDEALVRDAGMNLLFVPAPEAIYPQGHATSMTMAGAALGFEGDRRPGHFNGVALVCLKLFHLVEPDVVYLGQKDAQQVAVLRQLIRDVNLPIAVHVVPTVRAADGLALSSRNVRLSAAERERAAVIPRALRAGLEAWQTGADPARAARAALDPLEIDYADVATFDREPTLVVAVRVGTTRLIDNVPLNQPALAGLSPAPDP
jgi:pantoate--beta-alanine ligase